MLSYRTSYWKICNRRCDYFPTSADVVRVNSAEHLGGNRQRGLLWLSPLPRTFILNDCIRILGETCVVWKGSVVLLHYFGCRQRKGWFRVQIAGGEKKPACSWHMPVWREPLEHVAAFSGKAVIFIKAWIGRIDKWLWSKSLQDVGGIAK